MTTIQRQFVKKPWGAEDWLVKTDNYVAKHLFINPGEEISLQYHNQKEETMMVLSGMGTLVIGMAGLAERNDRYTSERTITEGDIFTIAPKTLHQVKASTALKLLEISTPQTEDLVRVRDRYAR